MHVFYRSLVFSCLSAYFCLNLAGEDEGFLFFEKKIRPVFAQHCYECHSAKSEKLKANLLLDRKEGWIQGGDSGPVINPGKPENSMLMKAIGYHDNDLRMPPKRKLPVEAIRDIENWIAMGAPDPRNEPIGEDLGNDLLRAKAPEEGRKYWAFRPLSAPVIPRIENQNWPADPLDHFLLAKLEDQGLRPAQPADRQVLMRRIHFDLIGLPPSPEQIEDFLADSDPDAFSKVVDGLLASVSFGERWGRHWLDVARYADTTGGGRNKPFPNASLYREYVINSYNEDKPFDRFVREQIAGDLLHSSTDRESNENLTALGFMALGPHNYELQDKELLRMEIVDEQMSSVGRAFLGVTMGCARCHDHPFDPIPTSEYYALAGIFRSTNSMVMGNVANFVERELKDGHDGERKIHAKRQKALEEKLKNAESKLKKLVLPSDSMGILVDDSDADLVGEWKKSTFVKGYQGLGYIHDAAEGKGRKKVVFPANIKRSGIYEIQFSYTSGPNRSKSTPVSVFHRKGVKKVMVDQTKPPSIQGSFVSLGTFPFETGKRKVVTVSNEATSGNVIVDAIRLVPQFDSKEAHALNQKAERNLGLERERMQLQIMELKQSIELHKKHSPPQVVKVMSVSEREEAGDWHIHLRGGIRNLGPVVKRGFLAVATPVSRSPTPDIPAGASGRLQLADWVASIENPLTARVYVNRVWHHLFGRGIVRSTDNFGEMGDRPSHPKLLDHLAESFIRNGWSTKELVRKIVHSKAYRMASNGNAKAERNDPENQLFSRQNRRRLEAEAIRDAILTASGRLIPSRTNPNLARSIFLKIDRNQIPEMFNVFDYPNPGVVSGKRNVSSVPTQALFMLNSKFVLDETKATAERILAASEEMEDMQRIELAYRLCLGRKPTREERSLALAYLDKSRGEVSEVDSWSGLIHGLFACIDFFYLN